MGFFSKKRSYLGIDIGASSIKLVELGAGPNRTPYLVTYGRAEQPADATRVDSNQDLERIVGALKEICRQAHTTTTKAVAALPTFTVFSSVISLPQMSDKELAAAVRWEARKFVPMPIEEMILDWKLLSRTPTIAEEASKDIRVLLTAAPQNVVKKYLDIFKGAGLELLSLETEAFAMERSLVGGGAGSVMVVDLGDVTTDICIAEKGIPILNRSIDIGGLTLTKAVAHSLNIDLKRAEQFKRDIGLSATPTAAGNIPKTIETTISPMINEIKYSLSLYQSQSPQSVEKIILTGGSAFLSNLPQYLENMFQIKCYVGDPWARVSVPVELKPILEEIGPRFATAIGLAMRDIV
ncbi:MAG: type IV pilus assembly protein PilM [Candidatus Kerfeldbacteria bacterium]|nr:type IV pilus assembly protein PilM [Candidatus Kerfeldbacteria bacterium]